MRRFSSSSSASAGFRLHSSQRSVTVPFTNSSICLTSTGVKLKFTFASGTFWSRSTMSR